MAWLAAGLWAGIVCGEALFAWMVTRGTVSLVSSTGLWAIGFLSAAATLYVVSRTAVPLLPVGGLITGVALSLVALGSWSGAVATLAEKAPTELSGIVASDPQQNRWGWEFDLSGDGLLRGWRATVTTDERPPARGTKVSVTGRLDVTDPAGRWGRWAWRDGSVGRLRAWDLSTRAGRTGGVWAARSRLLGDMGGVDDVGGPLLQGIVLGDRRGIPEDVAVDFRSSGLSHLLAVSGLHLGLVAIGVGRLLSAVGLRRSLQNVGIVAASAAFAALTGAQTPTLRALAMVVIVGVGSGVGRRSDGIGALSVAVMAMLASSPMAAFSVSLRLSVSAVGGLIVFARWGMEWLMPVVRSRRIAGGVAATLIAQASTGPFVAGAFHVVSLVSPLANLVAVPIASLALGIGVLGVALAGPLPVVSESLYLLAAKLMAAVASVAQTLGGLPHAAVCTPSPSRVTWLAWAGVGALVWWRWPTTTGLRSSLLACGGLTLALAVWVAWPISGPELVIADVGQADAIILADGGDVMLVDCGARAAPMAAALGRNRVRAAEVLVLTHAHDDHVGGLDALVGTTRVGWVGVPAMAADERGPIAPRDLRRLTPRGTLVSREVRAGANWWVGRTRVTVLWPDGPAVDRETNDTSVVLLLEREGWSAILGGDAEVTVWETLAAAGSLPDVDVLKASHHGSANGMTASALAAMAPETVLISVGKDNGFGHPSPEFLELVSSTGAEVIRTDVAGDIVLPLD